MINMDAFQAYRYYLALRLHFTTDDYNIVTHKGRVRASKDAFLKRRDLYAITKIAKTYTDEEIVNFLVSNFVSGNKWGGVFDSEANQTYISWKKKIESLTYTFKSDVKKIVSEHNLITFDEEQIFSIQKNQHPYIIRGYMSGEITIETLVILNKLFKFCDKFDEDIEEQYVWPDISRLIRKYNPFLKVDKGKYYAVLRDL